MTDSQPPHPIATPLPTSPTSALSSPEEAASAPPSATQNRSDSAAQDRQGGTGGTGETGETGETGGDDGHETLWERHHTIALSVCFLIGAPLFALFTVSALDGYRQRQQAPLQAIFGKETYQALQEGLLTPKHYLGANRRAPDFRLNNWDGTSWSLRKHRGKTLVLNFWSITCKPCIEEMPSLVSLAEITKDWGDTEVVTISTDANWSEVEALFGNKAPPFPVLFDPDKKVVREKFGSRMYPETWIIDSEGVIRMRYDGPAAWDRPLMLDVLRLFR